MNLGLKIDFFRLCKSKMQNISMIKCKNFIKSSNYTNIDIKSLSKNVLKYV